MQTKENIKEKLKKAPEKIIVGTGKILAEGRTDD